MASVLSINGSPSLNSKTAAVLADVARSLTRDGHNVVQLNVRELPAEDLLLARVQSPSIAEAIVSVERADGIVIGTPIYKAAYSGLLKTFLDLLPQFAFDKKTILPLATGGSLAHVLALDYGLRPVLSSLGARHVVGSYFILDKTIQLADSGQLLLDATSESKYREAVLAFTDSLHRHAHEGAEHAASPGNG